MNLESTLLHGKSKNNSRYYMILLMEMCSVEKFTDAENGLVVIRVWKNK